MLCLNLQECTLFCVFEEATVFFPFNVGSNFEQMRNSRIAIGSDHAGFELKERIKQFLKERGESVIDYGGDSCEPNDYPDSGQKVAKSVACGKDGLGILICGTGIGMSIVANKFPGVRAALVQDQFSAQMAREHTDANLLVLGARIVNSELVPKLVEIWLDSEFQGERHQRRIDKISQLEREIR